MALCLTLTGTQQVFVQQPIGMVRVKRDVIGIVGVGVNPNGVLTAFKDTAQDGGQ